MEYTTVNRTAEAGSDYSATSGTLTFTPGMTPGTQQILVPIVGDLVGELTEDFTVTLLNAGGATISGGSAIAHHLRQRSTADADFGGFPQVTEDNSGTQSLAFDVTFSGGAATPVTVSYTTANGTATGGERLHGDERDVDLYAGDDAGHAADFGADRGGFGVELTEDFTVTLSKRRRGDDRRGTGDRHDLRQRSTADAATL